MIYLGWILLAASLGAVDLTKVWGPRASFQVTFRVIDEEGRPVEGAKLGCGWGRMGFKEPDAGQANLLTGQIGEAVVTGRSVFNEYAFHAEKPGYYETRAPRPDLPLFKERANGRWQPWNPTVPVVLKRIRNPVPMYVRRVSASLPVLNKTVGYDLEIGDWVEPQGKGHTADMVFVGILEQRASQDFDWELQVSFSNPADGLQRFSPGSQTSGSKLRSPYEAPADGYVPSLTLTQSRRPNVRDQTTFKPEGGYFFRVRTELDAQGNVVKAWYGKIYGDFFDMAYYLNPDGTRNVEFDPKRNLFHPQNDRDSAFWNLGP
ncbi:MAG: hypothetical protein PHQ04_10000 [Opitutaceae bacterium]|nr:hypothetical protein [Opitutaceae bacterium]